MMEDADDIDAIKLMSEGVVVWKQPAEGVNLFQTWFIRNVQYKFVLHKGIVSDIQRAPTTDIEPTLDANQYAIIMPNNLYLV